MRENKFLWYIALALICWALYTSVFDTGGNFDPTTHLDVIEYRLGYRLRSLAGQANDTIEEENRAMQGVVDGRARRVRKKVDADTHPKRER